MKGKRSKSFASFASLVDAELDEDDQSFKQQQFERDASIARAAARERVVQPHGNININQYYQKVNISREAEEASDEVKDVCSQLLKCTKLRAKYVSVKDEPDWHGMIANNYKAFCDSELQKLKIDNENAKLSEPPYLPMSDEYNLYQKTTDLSSTHSVICEGGLFFIAQNGKIIMEEEGPMKINEFIRDLKHVLNVAYSAACKSFSFKRLKILESLFYLHKLLNSDRENVEQKAVPHRDFYNCRKVDTHIHHTAVMNQKHLLRFIKHKLKYSGDEIVYKNRDGELMSMKEVFKSLNLSAYDLSIDTLDMHAEDTFHRFDRFNLKYNPIGESSLREIFLKTNNLIKGKYLADISKEVFSDLASNKYVYIEPRISIYGKKRDEFKSLAEWWHDNQLCSPHVRFLIQVPRLYSVYKKNGIINNFQEMLDNIFIPLFENSIKPERKLDLFLRQVVGFDCVDDESKMTKEHSFNNLTIRPLDWTYDYDPPFSYWMYYLYANLKSLNNFRAQQGLSTFEFRPHVGEAGDVDNLASAFLIADKINHGILLRRSPALQYLYYVSQIGLALSPLSNNKLFLDYHSNPFPDFFARGLNVSLSTDDPLLLHITKEPLVEEYSCAAQVWKMSSTDLSEIARNSVLQSGFEHPFKQHFLGKDYFGQKPKNVPNLYREYGNDIGQTNVPQIRLLYRAERLNNEWAYLKNVTRDGSM